MKLFTKKEIQDLLVGIDPAFENDNPNMIINSIVNCAAYCFLAQKENNKTKKLRSIFKYLCDNGYLPLKEEKK